MRRGHTVGVCLDRSAAQVTALLAVMRAGGVYVPVDPGYPAGRIAYVLDDSAPHVLLVRDAERIPAGAAPAGGVLDLAGLTGAPAPGPDCGEAPAPAPDDAAYMIYTSGSTGRPKGVVVPHAGLPGLAAAHIDALALDSGSRVLQYVSPSFDVAMADILMTSPPAPPWSSPRASRWARSCCDCSPGAGSATSWCPRSSSAPCPRASCPSWRPS
ncbi:AMP-binding protein [Streptomyces albus]|nr:AMP-binding protein [Streptomyces albus]